MRFGYCGSDLVTCRGRALVCRERNVIDSDIVFGSGHGGVARRLVVEKETKRNVLIGVKIKKLKVVLIWKDGDFRSTWARRRP